jgi:hypothetical protein
MRNFTQSGGAATPAPLRMRQQIAGTLEYQRAPDQGIRPESHDLRGLQPAGEAQSQQESEDAVCKVPLPSGRDLW